MSKRRGKTQDRESTKGDIPEISDEIPEISDDDFPGTMRKEDPGYHIPLSSKSKSWTEKLALKLKQAIPFWNDQKIWILIGIFLTFQLITVVYFKHLMENKIANLKSCQKRVANSDESVSCSDCMCIATDGFSSKEFLDVIENQQEARKKYKELEEANNVLRSQLSDNQKKVEDTEQTLSKYEKKNNDEYFDELFHRNWEKKKDIFTKKIEETETSLKHSLNEGLKDVEKISQNVLSQVKEQHKEITEVKD